MKVYCLIQKDRHYGTEVDVFADKDESIQTAASRIERDVNRWREDDGKKKLTVEEIVSLGTSTSDELLVQDINEEGFGLNESMVAGDSPWVFYCAAYDDGPTFWVVEKELIK